jgi:hypothetical protein
MSDREQNWTNLFGEYTSNEIAWHGIWTVYSPEKEIIKSDALRQGSRQRATRSFSVNEDKTIVTHINRHFHPDGSHDEKIWHLDKEKCNFPDGVVHPAKLLRI